MNSFLLEKKLELERSSPRSTPGSTPRGTPRGTPILRKKKIEIKPDIEQDIKPEVKPEVEPEVQSEPVKEAEPDSIDDGLPDDFIREIKVSGRCEDHWKTGNLMGVYKVSILHDRRKYRIRMMLQYESMDETGRPKFASVEKTDAGTTVMLFYFEPMKCWHISAKMSEKAEKKNRNLGNCWVYVKSDVQHPVEIKEQWWHEAVDVAPATKTKGPGGGFTRKTKGKRFNPHAANVTISAVK